MENRSHYILFAAVIAVIVTGIMVLHLPTYIPLLVCTAIVSVYCIAGLKLKAGETLKTIAKAGLQAPWPLLLSIGILIASWVACGTVPFLVVSGLKLIRPQFFLPSVLLI